MTAKTSKIISWVLMAIPSAILVLSGVSKLSGNPQVVEGLSKMGYGPIIKVLGVAELIFVALFLYPKTYKIGFYLILSYLGGAAAIEIAGGGVPAALIYVAFAWAAVFVRDKYNFFPTHS